MYAKVNVGTMHQDAQHRRLCLAGPWQSRIQQRIISWWMVVFCLFMLSTVVMAQDIESRDATNNGDDGSTVSTTSPTTIADREGSMPKRVQESLIPVITVGYFVFTAISNALYKPSSDILSFLSDHCICAGFVLAYTFCITIVPFDSGETSIVKLMLYTAVGMGAGLLDGISAIRRLRTDIAIANTVGSFIGLLLILVVKPETYITNMTELIAFRVFFFAVPTVALSFLIYKRGERYLTHLATVYKIILYTVPTIDVLAKSSLTTNLVYYIGIKSEVVYAVSPGICILLGIILSLSAVTASARTRCDLPQR
jgi:hypothetical protein